MGRVEKAVRVHENAVCLADNAVRPPKLDDRSLLCEDVGVKEDLTKARVTILRLLRRSALKTYLIGNRLDLRGAEECLQLRHVEVSDADAPVGRVNTMLWHALYRLASQVHRSAASPSLTMRSECLARQGEGGG